MCGIAGMVGPAARALTKPCIEKVRAAIRYRGRDEEGEWTDGAMVRLLHSRLSIIDLEEGGQPMVDCGGRYVIVFNGEIYNYRELRSAYEKLGAKFRTQSDTEVILEGFKLYGEDVCRQLNGMFAFAIWDQNAKKLFLARDHLGKKPLVWCMINKSFFFASTLDAFRGLPGWSDALCRGSILLYSFLGGFPEDRTVYSAARSLPWGCRAWVSPERPDPTVDRYWRLDFSQKSVTSLEDACAEYRDLLIDATSLRLRADVPIGLSFSGGVDSGSIAAVCGKVLGRSLKCFTIDYDTPEDRSDETRIARRAADQTGGEWRHVQFDYHQNLLDDLPHAYRYFDQPCQQLPLVYSLRLYEAMRNEVTVVLSGNGADELFTGYVGDHEIRKTDVLRGSLGWLPTSLARVLQKFASPTLWRALLQPGQIPAYMGRDLEAHARAWRCGPNDEDTVRSTICRTIEEASAAGVDSFLDWKMYSGLSYSAADTNYRLPDVTGLAAQVEVRSPFLDPRMVEFAARLPHRYKIRGFRRAEWAKYLPKRVYASYVSDDIAWASKKGMGWNLRWHESIVTDARFDTAFSAAFDAIEAANIDADEFRKAHVDFKQKQNPGSRATSSAGTMMQGFMLGAWLLGRETVSSTARNGLAKVN